MTKTKTRHNKAMFFMFIGFIMVWVIMHLMYMPRAYGETEYPDLDKVNELSEKDMSQAYTDLCEDEFKTLPGQIGCLRNQTSALKGMEKIIQLSVSMERLDILNDILECADKNITPQGVIDWVEALHCTANKVE